MILVFSTKPKRKERMYSMTGKVKWFNANKGYGFINRGEGNDIFVHYSQIVFEGYKTLQEGQEVEFEVLETDHGLQAQNVVAITQ